MIEIFKGPLCLNALSSDSPGMWCWSKAPRTRWVQPLRSYSPQARTHILVGYWCWLCIASDRCHISASMAVHWTRQGYSIQSVLGVRKLLFSIVEQVNSRQLSHVLDRSQMKRTRHVFSIKGIVSPLLFPLWNVTFWWQDISRIISYLSHSLTVLSPTYKIIIEGVPGSIRFSDSKSSTVMDGFKGMH